MVYSNTTTKDGIIQHIETMCDLGDGYISGTTAELRKFNAIINRVYGRIWHTIHSHCGNWKFDDGNHEDLPSATINLEEGQRRYPLIDEALTIERVKVKDENGNWYIVHPITQKSIRGEGIDSFLDDNGRPMYYRLFGNIIELYAPANYSQADSLKIYYTRDMVSFDYDDTDAEPMFPSPYHEIIPIKASIEWYKIKQPLSPTLQTLKEDNALIDESIKVHYRSRFKDYPARITRKAVSYK